MQDELTGTATDTSQKSTIDNYEQYLLNSRGAIIQKLRQLGKSKNMITVHFGGGKHSMLTYVVDVLPDRDLLVLDYGSNESMNEKVLKATRVVFKTQHQGITAQFTTTDMQRAKLHGRTAFACPLPESLLWVQRREFYRVRIPISEPLLVELITDDGEKVQYNAIDISIGGVSLHDTSNAIPLEAGQDYHHCKLLFSTGESGLVSLSVRNILPFKHDDPTTGDRIGCSFNDLSMDLSASIQRYIHAIDAHMRKVKEE